MPSLWGQKVVIATHNKGKLEEFAALLRPFDIKTVSAGALGLIEPEETETSFEGNARIKAQAALNATGFPVIADDSGLCVEALGGRPGVYTADWAGPGRDWRKAMQRVEEELVRAGATEVEQRRAAFMCTLLVLWPDGEERLYVGQAKGHLIWPPRGALGHGYDPMFIPEGQPLTFAEMTAEEKNRRSHRAQALALLLRDLV